MFWLTENIMSMPHNKSKSWLQRNSWLTMQWVTRSRKPRVVLCEKQLARCSYPSFSVLSVYTHNNGNIFFILLLKLADKSYTFNCHVKKMFWNQYKRQQGKCLMSVYSIFSQLEKQRYICPMYCCQLDTNVNLYSKLCL